MTVPSFFQITTPSLRPSEATLESTTLESAFHWFGESGLAAPVDGRALAMTSEATNAARALAALSLLEAACIPM